MIDMIDDEGTLTGYAVDRFGHAAHAQVLGGFM